jgi:hypothetical protein
MATNRRTQPKRLGSRTKLTARGKPKRVASDLKDVAPGRWGAAFPHDREQTSPVRRDRRPKAAGDRSNDVPRATPRGDNEQRGGRDRTERKRRDISRSAVAPRGR